MTEESEHKMEFPSWVRLTSGKNLFQYFLPYVELSLYYLILECTGKPFLVDLDMFHGAKSPKRPDTY